MIRMNILDLFKQLEDCSVDEYGEICNEVLDYIGHNSVDQEDLTEIFTNYEIHLHKYMAILICQNSKLDEEFMIEFGDFLYWNEILKYQKITHHVFLKNRKLLAGEGFTDAKIKKMIENKAIKIDEDEKNKFEMYFNMTE